MTGRCIRPTGHDGGGDTENCCCFESNEAVISRPAWCPSCHLLFNQPMHLLSISWMYTKLLILFSLVRNRISSKEKNKLAVSELRGITYVRTPGSEVNETQRDHTQHPTAIMAWTKQTFIDPPTLKTPLAAIIFVVNVLFPGERWVPSLALFPLLCCLDFGGVIF